VSDEAGAMIIDGSNAAAASEFRARLRLFIEARNRYLNGAIALVQGQTDHGLAACIDSARISPDFTTGYAHAIQIAIGMAKTDPPRARETLERLDTLRPDLLDARQALRQLFRE
jgi:hypothetical protein